MGPTWSPPGFCRPRMGHMLALWTLLSGEPMACYSPSALTYRMAHRRWTLTAEYLEDSVNACCVYSVENVSITNSLDYLLYILCNILVCVQLAHESFGDPEDIFVTNIVIIKYQLSHRLCFRVCVFEMAVPSNSAICFIYMSDQGKLGFCLYYCWAICGVFK